MTNGEGISSVNDDDPENLFIKFKCAEKLQRIVVIITHSRLYDFSINQKKCFVFALYKFIFRDEIFRCHFIALFWKWIELYARDEIMS